MILLGSWHERHVTRGRTQRLAQHVAELVPAGAEVLDVGCGDGRLASLVAQRRADVRLRGIDVLVPPDACLPVTPYDGDVIPFGDASVDVVMLIDALHHARDPLALLREAARVARRGLIIKDHTREGFLADATLRLMDWRGNAHRGVALPYAYWPKRQWLEAFQALGLRLASWKADLGLYPWPVSLVCDRSLHFLARLEVSR